MVIIGDSQSQANSKALADKLHEEEVRSQKSEVRIQKKDPHPDPLPACREREEEEGLRLVAREAIIGA